MIYDPKLLPNRVELAKKILNYLDTYASAKIEKDKSIWHTVHVLDHDLRHTAMSIIELLDENDEPKNK